MVDVPKELSPRGLKRRIIRLIKEDLVGILLETPDLWQEELREYVELEYGINVSRQTISNIIKRLEFTRKVLA